MTPLVWTLDVDYSAALRKVAAFAAEAQAASKAKPITITADITPVVKAQQQVEAAAVKAAVASERAAAREEMAWRRAADEAILAAQRQEAAQEAAYQKAAMEAEKAAERQMAAQQRLNALAASTTGEKANAAFAGRKAEIERLLAVTGDQVAADKALKVAQQDVARSLVQGGVAATEAAKGTGKAGAAMGMLGMQLSDVASQLSTGTNPFTILIQQGPQVAYAVEQGGGATAIFNTALSGLGVTAGVVGAALAALTVTVAAGATAYTVFANATTTAESQAYDLNETIYQQGLTAGTTAEEVKALDTAWTDFSGAMQTAQEYIATVNGDLEEWEVKAGKLARTVMDGTKAQIMAGAQNIASLKQQKDAVQALIDSERTSAAELPELFARRKALNAEIAVAVPRLEEEKAAVEETVAATLRAAQQEEEERKAKERQTSARKAHKDALKDEDEWLRRLNAAMQEENQIAEENEKNYKAAITGIDGIVLASSERAQGEKSAAQVVLAAYDDQIAKIEEYLRQARDASLGEATIEASQKAAKAREDVERDMQAQLSDIREKAGMDALAQMNATAEKQEGILRKGARDAMQIAADLASATKAAAVDLVSAVLDGTAKAAEMALQAESKAASSAFGEVERLQSLIEGLGLDTVDAATLSGKALVKAYKTGAVAAEDLTDAQKAQVEDALKAKEKAAEKEAKMHKRAALEAWNVSQAVSYAQAVVQGGLAIVNALATVPYPAAPIAAVAAGVATGVQIAEIASAEPPSFRAGGVIGDLAPSASSLLPDARLIAAEVGESINTRRGTQTLGGEEGVRAINAGIPPAPTVVNLKLRHQTLETIMQEQAKRPGTLRSLTRHPSRTNPYIGRSR